MTKEIKRIKLSILMSRVRDHQKIDIAKKSVGEENYEKLIKDGMIYEVGDVIMLN